MEVRSGAPDAQVIVQDEDTEIRVQPVTQGAIRHLDIHIWKRGPSGFTPTHDALILGRADLEALRQGIVELLEASEGGKQVARIVLDSGDGRRLRAETEPFGTRYVAHFGFWQRGRDSWRQDGDGIVLFADRLPALQSALPEYAAWLDEPAAPEPQSVPADMHRAVHEPWPAPGGDWLTVEPNRVTLHPRGNRITLSIEGGDEGHRLLIRQWRREGSLWIPESAGLTLAAADLDSLLRHLGTLLVRAPDQESSEKIPLSDGSSLQIRIDGEKHLRIDQELTEAAGEPLPCITLPAEYLPRLGRALAQTWSMLVGRLSDDERERLRLSTSSPEAPASETTEGSFVQPAPPPPPVPRAVGPAVRFGENSAYPGAIIPQEGQVRIVVEGYLLPRGLTLPMDVIARVVSGLEELYSLQLSQPRIAPMLMCDRPDCAVYGRVGTTTRPEAVEIRVWSSPRSSDAVTFDRAYLPEMIEGLRQALRVLGQPEPLPSMSFLTAQRVKEHFSPPAVEQKVVTIVEKEKEKEEEPAQPELPLPIVHLSEVQLADQLVRFDLEGPDEDQLLAIRSGEGVLRLKVEELDDLLAKVRSLYYDALRGRRGRPLVAGTSPSIEVGVQNQGAAMHLQLRDASGEEDPAVSFESVHTSAFLNAARSALERKPAEEE